MAVQCDDVTEYSETWTGEQSGGSVPLYGRGVGEAQTPCNITLRTYITAPSGSELTSVYASGIQHVESTVLVYLNGGSAEGNYTTNTEAWSQGIHFGCAMAVAGLSSILTNYVYLQPDGTEFGVYNRCSPGECNTIRLRCSLMDVGSCTQYARIHVIKISILGAGLCFAVSGQVQASCASP